MAEAYLLENLDKEEWFKPHITRETAESLLKESPIGSFVVRSSSKKDHYALSYKEPGGRVVHSLIQKSAKGYTLPNGDDEMIYPTIVSLLSVCKHISFTKTGQAEFVLSDEAFARMVEAFPDAPIELIQRALKSTNNNVNSAIDVLINNGHISSKTFKPSQSSSFQSQQQQQQQQSQQHQQQTKPQNETNNKHHNPLVAFSNLTIGPPKGPILKIFKEHSKRDIPTSVHQTWTTLPTALVQSGPSRKLESHLDKILVNPNHALGKGVRTFVGNFNGKYQSGYIPATEVEKKYPFAVNEVQQFITKLSEKIRARVEEFKSNEPGLWRTVESNVFPYIYPNILALFQGKHAVKNSMKTAAMNKFADIDIRQTDIPEHLQLHENPAPYSRAIHFLKMLPSVQTLNEKYTCLSQACLAVNEAVSEYYSRFAIPSDKKPVVTSDDLHSIFTYVLIKSQVVYCFSEVAIMGEFLPDALAGSLECFAFSTYEAAVRSLDTFFPRSLPDTALENRPPELRVQKAPSEELLPQGWERRFDSKGRAFFIDYINKKSTYDDPRSRPAIPSYTPPTSPTTPLVPLIPRMVPSPNLSRNDHKDDDLFSSPMKNGSSHSQHDISLDDPFFIQKATPINNDKFLNPTNVADTMMQFSSPRPNRQTNFLSFEDNSPPSFDNTSDLSNMVEGKDSLRIPQGDTSKKWDTLSKAEKAYVESLKNSPPSVEVNLQLAAYYYAQGKQSKAMLYCTQALALAPNNPDAQQAFSLYCKGEDA